MTPRWRFVADDLDSDDVQALLRFHLTTAHANSPADKVHALDLSGLRVPEVTLWAARDGDALVGMGALKLLGEGRAEIKSMRVAPDRLRQGIGRALLHHLLAEARARGVRWIGLETGGNDAFVPARAMYERAGFAECEAFGDYVTDDFSRCYSMAL
ncbi:GNAT family N-acetyltransferase [Sphingomonas sp.]|uniref:GNAT family N-acetyltransferase n=1 Tax=Sphingomonas sp. TaxID=28214 RepID=UPI002DD65078|nr:GNAT family N-acetyltransferase [Sphingomonas sp.]